MSGWDSDRSVRNAAKRCWDSVIISPSILSTEEEEVIEGIRLTDHAESILSFARSLIFLPTFIPSADPLVDAAEEDPALLRSQALLTLSHLLRILPSPLSNYFADRSLQLFKADEVWTLVDASGPSILRRSAYELLGSISERADYDIFGRRAKEAEQDDDGEDEEEDEDQSGVLLVARYIMRHCWSEEEGWAGVIAFLRRAGFFHVCQSTN